MYPSKLLLFGEYTIIQNSCALAIPYTPYRSFWIDAEVPDIFLESTIDEAFSRESLYKILEDLQGLKKPLLDLKQLEADLDRGLWLCSNVPIGYGLGSSGAVCAAIYERYALEKASDFQELKEDLASLEQSFHGKSSGIDPLICYSQQSLLIQENKKITPVELAPKALDKLYLIDSKQSRISSPLIDFFVKECEKEDFLESYVEPAKKAAKKAIDALLIADNTSLKEAFRQISELQFMYLAPMILPSMRALWFEGLESQDFYLKICGAGGGGFLLVYADEIKNAELQKAAILPIYNPASAI